MAVCLSCGKEIEGLLCDECRQSVDMEKLCGEISMYSPLVDNNPDANPIWEKIASEMESPNNFKDYAFALASFLPSPRKEYQQILSRVGKYYSVHSDSKPWFYETYEQIIGAEGITEEEKLILKGIMLGSLYQEYRYFEADEVASELLDADSLPAPVIYFMAEFFSQTRRYDEADYSISLGKRVIVDNEFYHRKFEDLNEKNEKRKNGGKEYLPQKSINREKYIEFMSAIGIDVNLPQKAPEPIPNSEYPEVVEKREADFDSFVAFDFETTGLSTRIDTIIEVGAIRVVNGEIVESAEFTFSELVKPFKRRIANNITELTGLTTDDVKDARQMWEVTPDFMKFVGNDILVGYNNIAFDSKFLRRAGRYSNEIYTNKHFDVKRYVKGLKNVIDYTGENFELGTVGEFLGIENPEAHRALADAITTAKIFLKLKEMSGGASAPASADSVLDLEEW